MTPTPASNPLDLLPCAYCGGLACLDGENGRWWVECDDCGATSFRMLDAEKAKAWWNRRPAPAPGLKVSPQGPAVEVGTVGDFNFLAHLARQAAWSEKTFGPGARTKGVCDHIRKELLEIEADLGDLKEWIDVVILGLDGAWRTGATPAEIIAAIAAKQAKNEARTWPDWRTMDPDKAIEHDRTGEAPQLSGNPGQLAQAPGEQAEAEAYLRDALSGKGFHPDPDILRDSIRLGITPKAQPEAKGRDTAENDHGTDPVLSAFAQALGFMPPTDGDGFWGHQEIGPVHCADLYSVALDMAKARQPTPGSTDGGKA